MPDGYERVGELFEEEVKYSHIDGNKYYTDKSQDSLLDFYVYQECGTSISENEVDSTKKTRGYVK